MTREYTYRDSHKAPDKGEVYEEHYETLPWQRFLWLREQDALLRIIEKYFCGRDIFLLDFACGTGRITSFLESRVKTSTSVDVSSSMLAVARKKLRHTEIMQVDITIENTLKGRKFNLITAFRFFLNAEPQLRLAAIKVLAELLAEDGYLVFNNHQSYDSPWIKLQHAWHRWKDPEGTFNVMSIGEMEELVEGVGLKIMELYPVGFFHPPKVPVSQMLTNMTENIGCKFKCLTRFSESPIAVCRLSKSTSES